MAFCSVSSSPALCDFAFLSVQFLSDFFPLQSSFRNVKFISLSHKNPAYHGRSNVGVGFYTFFLCQNTDPKSHLQAAPPPKRVNDRSAEVGRPDKPQWNVSPRRGEASLYHVLI